MFLTHGELSIDRTLVFTFVLILVWAMRCWESCPLLWGLVFSFFKWELPFFLVHPWKLWGTVKWDRIAESRCLCFSSSKSHHQPSEIGEVISLASPLISSMVKQRVGPNNLSGSVQHWCSLSRIPCEPTSVKTPSQITYYIQGRVRPRA